MLCPLVSDSLVDFCGSFFVNRSKSQFCHPGLDVPNPGIPDAGLGVFNEGQTVPADAHFEEVKHTEETMTSPFCWVVGLF